MPETISKDGLYVETQALLNDASTWTANADSMRVARESVHLPKDMFDEKPVLFFIGSREDDVLREAGSLILDYLEYCKQGESEFISTSETLKKIAKDYEDNEREVFSKEG